MEFCNIHAGYGKNCVLTDISVSFAPASITSVIGLNGSGKSTLLRCACRLMRPQSGTILLDGTDIASLSPRELARRVAILPQNRPIPEMSVEEMVLYGRFPHLRFGGSFSEKDHHMARQVMEQCGVYHLRSRNVRTLSGGERQRAYIAMAAAQDTPWLLLDEPTASLDLPHRFEVLRLLRTMSRQGKSILLVLHELVDALSFSDFVVVLQKGAIRAAGTPDEILALGIPEELFRVRVWREENGFYSFTPL